MYRSLQSHNGSLPGCEIHVYSYCNVKLRHARSPGRNVPSRRMTAQQTIELLLFISFYFVCLVQRQENIPIVLIYMFETPGTEG